MSLGKTLKDVQRLSKKQSKKKNYMGWFQSFGGGESPINNAFFNMAMGSADGIAGAGKADGGIGMTASMGESLNEENESTPFTIESFRSNSGKDYVAEFLDSLDEMSRASVDTDLSELERLGTRAREPLSKPLGKGLFELRSKTPMGNVRILYFFLKGRIILLTNGFVKKTWAVPQDEIDIARRRMKEYTQRFGGK